MPYEITQCYLPPGRGDFPAFTPAEAGTRFSDPGGMQGWVDVDLVIVKHYIEYYASDQWFVYAQTQLGKCSQLYYW